MPSDAGTREHRLEPSGEELRQVGEEHPRWKLEERMGRSELPAWHYGLEVESAQVATKRDSSATLAKAVATGPKEAGSEPWNACQWVAGSSLWIPLAPGKSSHAAVCFQH